MSSTKKTEFKGITKRVREMLKTQESYDVEFKESLSGLEASDIVAFANSRRGGTILIGVREVEVEDGRQLGRIIGCDVSDRKRLSILNKASSCVPFIELEVFIENISKKPIFRIEIPSGQRKPYSTYGGTYKIRGNGRVNALYPVNILSMFMETETKKFLKSFRLATGQLEDGLEKIKDKIVYRMNHMHRNIASLEEEIQNKLEIVFNSAEMAEMLSDNVMNNSEETLGKIELISSRIDFMEDEFEKLNKKLDRIIKNLRDK